MNTLLLNLDGWDLCVDANGNIAMATEPYSQAQDAASAIKLFLGEAYYDTSLGVPYFQSILGKRPTLTFIKTQLENAAKTVPGVAVVQIFLSDFSDRKLSGQVIITNDAGQTATASF